MLWCTNFTLGITIDVKIQVVLLDVHKNPSQKIMKTSYKARVSYSVSPWLACGGFAMCNQKSLAECGGLLVSNHNKSTVTLRHS